MMKQLLLTVIVYVSLVSVAFSQETRATLTGRVTDPTGAIVPNVQIQVVDTDTGAQTTAVSNKDGDYTVPFLVPGTYKVSVQSNGFKTYVQMGILLQTEQTVTENVVMQVGNASESVTVTAGTPLIDTATDNIGQSLTSEEVEELPSYGRSPIGFAHMEFGAVAKGKHSMVETRPFDNSAASDFGLGGGNSQSNEVLMNGVPDMEDGGRVSAYSPQLDAVDAVHVDEFSANADLGDTSGGFVNLTTKAGSNEYHGTASEYYDGSRPLQAEPYFTAPGAAIASTHFNQVGGTFGGPVWIPHVIHGRNKLFFFYAFEGWYGKTPTTTITSVPTEAERQGDFSALLAYNAADQLYNPYGATEVGSVITRSPIPNNCLTNQSSYCSTVSNAGLTIDPVAAAYMKMIPMPNYTGSSAKADGENNFYADDPTTDNYESNQARFDYIVSDSNKAYFDVHRSNLLATSGQIFGGNNILTGSTATTIMWGGVADDVQTFSPSLSLDSRLGFSRYESFGAPASAGVNPTTVGMPGYIASNSTVLALPYLTFSDASPIPSLSAQPPSVEYYTDIQLFESVTKVVGRHTIKFGVDLRSAKEALLNPNPSSGTGGPNGEFTFSSGNNDFVTASNQSSGAKQQFGGAFALFDLGLPTAGGYSLNKGFAYSNWYHAGFIQDDWKIMHNLSVSFGLRLEHETPVVEGGNQLVSGWNSSTVNAATVQAEANYAAAPNAILNANAFSPTGGVTYATSSARSAYYTGDAYYSPRVGFNYSPDFSHGTLALRGGAGIYINPLGDYDFNQSYGFSQTSTMNLTYNNMLSPSNPVSDPLLSDPFPTGSVAGTTANPILTPFGSAVGINTQLGSSMSFYDPQVRVPYAQKWTVDIQKQEGRNWMFELGYMGLRQIHDSYSNTISSIPLLPFLSHTPTAAGAATVTTAMAVATTNPFKGLFPATPDGPNTTGLNTGSTLTAASLIQAYPEYTGVTEQLVPGSKEIFNALLFRVQKHMSYGLDFFFNYQWSRQMGYTQQLNAGGPLWYGETSSDFPQHGALVVDYALPWGKGRQFLSNSGVLDELVGGYKITGIYEFDSGTPDTWSNVNYSGNWQFNNHPHTAYTPSFTTSGFNTTSGSANQPGTYNFRTFPEYLLREDPTKNTNLSVLKNFDVGERFIIQPRFDAFNAFNRHQLSAPNLTPTSSAFSEITSQLNTGRNMQMGVHILF
jgi:Carboxypeptidase regulatory-like domain